MFSIIGFVTLQKARHWEPVYHIGRGHNEERRRPGVVRVHLHPPPARAGGQVGDKRSADVKTDHVHAEKRNKEKVMRANGCKQTDCLRELNVKSEEKKNLSYEQGTDQAEQVPGRLTLSEFFKAGIYHDMEKEEHQTKS